MSSATRPVWELPEVQEKVKAVQKHIVTICRARNLFAWRDFVEEAQADIEMWIYHYEELYRQGKSKELGIGAYNIMATQSVLNYAAYYSAKKRRLNYEAQSLDSLVETEKGSVVAQIPAQNDYKIEQIDLLMSIESQFGETISALVAKVLNGDQLSRKDLSKLRKTEGLKEYLYEAQKV